MKFGQARYGGEYKKKNYWKLKDGDSIFRILPPMGDLAEKGIWSAYYNVHYGYRTADNKMKTFQSPLEKNRQTKMIDQPDAALDFINSIKAKIEAAKAAGDKPMVEKLQEFAGGQKSRFNLDSHHYMNAMDLQGNIGVLKLRHKCKLALEATIKSLRAKGLDPLSPNDGRFFVFRRSGNALETTFQVEVYAEERYIENVGTVKQDRVSVLTQDIVDRLASEAVQLDKIFQKPTSAEVQAIVSSTDPKTGISQAIAGILAAPLAEEEPEEDEPTQYSPPVAQASAPAAVIAPVQAAPAPAPQAAAPAPVAVQAVQAPAPVQPAAQVQAPAPAATVTTTVQAVAAQSDADFLANLGVKM